ncbi:MAG TPA: coproporphyrinogen dehydrogenase HemZ [Clostridia bacterium]|nr:coproporphyrinogen dehydrogenase HemZ [Clostridia bacterium]
MIGIVLENHDFYNEAADIIRMYFGKCEIEKVERALANSQSFLQEKDVLVTSSLELSGRSGKCISKYRDKQRLEEAVMEDDVEPTDIKALKRLVKKSMYKLLSAVFEKEFPWGILTGIRPVKIVHELMDKGIPTENIAGRLMGDYLMSVDRALLALEIAGIERPFIYPFDDRVVSIYIGIPFCPSRCHYCSFTSNSISKYGAYVEPYLESLMKEMQNVAEYLDSKGCRVQSIYIGGGTPTALEAEQLDRLLKCTVQSFGEDFTEFTCEAGRPDSITEEKLKVLHQNNVSRISINPQTMNDETLKCIGRAHAAGQVADSFRQARNAGFSNINADLILGLPGEGLEQLAFTLSEIKKLEPENVTVHTMAIKRASIYNEGSWNTAAADDEHVSEMMEYAKACLREMGLHPYYLYRQKHMLQNLENIGFSKKGHECIYNMQIMEEKQTIVAFGADAVTKIVINSGNRIERQHNIKDVKLYIEKINEMIDNKIDILEQLWKTY